MLSQSQVNIEYIIIDGASTDGTLDIINTYRSHIAHIVSEPDDGIYDAMNKGMSLATGTYIGTLNSDDFYIDSNVVHCLTDKIESEKTDSVFADLLIVDPIDTNSVKRYYDSGHFHPNRLKFGLMPAHPTMLVRRSVYDHSGGYAAGFKIAADFEMMVRLYHKHKCSYSYIPQPMVKMRSGGVSTSGVRSSILLNQEIVRACRHHGLNSNLPMLLMKGPTKIKELIRGRFHRFVN